MWLIFGGIAVVLTVCNIAFFIFKKDGSLLAFMSMALTALTVCAFYSDAAGRVVVEDWGGLMDILPTMSQALWVCVLLSIIVNGIPVLLNKKACKDI